MTPFKKVTRAKKFPLNSPAHQDKFAFKPKQRYELSVCINNTRGMHTRPSTSVHDIAVAFDLVNIKVALKDHRPVSAKDVLGLIALEAKQGSTLNIKVKAKTNDFKAKQQALQGIAALKLLICDCMFFDAHSGRNTYNKQKMGNFIREIKSLSIDALTYQLGNGISKSGENPLGKNRIKRYFKKPLDKKEIVS